MSKYYNDFEPIKKFLFEEEALGFCDADPRPNLFVVKGLDGRFHVYDGDQ